MNVTPRTGDARRKALFHYCVAALAARTADAGAGVGLALAAAQREPPLASSTIGLLVAALALPHLLGPVLARWLDASSDYRRVMTAAAAVYATAMAALAASLANGLPTTAIAVLALIAGTVGPLLTGGLSSRLADLVDPDPRVQERARGWDAVTYGVAGFAGPAIAVVVATVAPATATLLALGALAAVAAGSVLLLPLSAPSTMVSPVASRAVARLIMTNGPLRRTAVITMAAALVQSTTAVTAVVVDGGRGVNGASLVAATGAGNLLGSLWVTARPSARRPEPRVFAWGVVLAALLALSAAVPSSLELVVGFAMVGAANAPLFTAALAVRSDQAPQGGRAQVFVWSAGLKIGASSGGSALGGAAAGIGLPGVLLLSACTLMGASTAMWVEQRVTRTPRNPTAA